MDGLTRKFMFGQEFLCFGPFNKPVGRKKEPLTMALWSEREPAGDREAGFRREWIVKHSATRSRKTDTTKPLTANPRSLTTMMDI